MLLQSYRFARNDPLIKRLHCLRCRPLVQESKGRSTYILGERLEGHPAASLCFSHLTGSVGATKDVHNKIIDIYPFEKYNGELAIFALNYYLMENGLAPISMALTRQEYQNQVSDCLKGVHQEVFYQFLCGAIYDKMNGTIEACREYIKNQD